MTPVEIARSVPIATLVARDCKMIGDYAFCPFHGPERTPSLHIHRKGNFFKCFGCGISGGPITWVEITRKVDFPTAVRELCGDALWHGAARPISPPAKARAPRETKVPSLVLKQRRDDKAWYIAELWRTADAPAIAELYLDSRGLRLRPKPLPEALRGHRAVWCAEVHEHRPATLAALTDDSGRVLAVQRIWCSDRLETVNGKSPPKGTRATDLKAPKKTIGRCADGAVRLGEPGPILGLTEGVEDALAVRQIYSIPCWAMLGGERLGALALPRITREVVIFGDADAAGRALAQKAVASYPEASIVYPRSGAKDFCEELNGHG